MTSWQPARPRGAIALALATTVTLPAWGQVTPAVTPLPRGQTLTLMQAWQAATQHDRQLDVARADQAACASRVVVLSRLAPLTSALIDAVTMLASRPTP